MRTQATVFPFLATVALIGTTASPSFGAGPRELFDRLWADHLPEYCLYTQLLPDRESGLYHTPAGKEYQEKYGPAFFHTHHYCWGLDKCFEAAREEDDYQRRALYESAVEEFDYVLLRSTNDFVLRPQIYVNKGLAQEALGLNLDAVESYTEALRLKSDYVPAYVGLSNCFEALGDPQRALTIVEAGLVRVPESEPLLERRLTLTGRVSTKPN